MSFDILDSEDLYETKCSVCQSVTKSIRHLSKNEIICPWCYAALSSDTKKLFSSPTIEQVIKELDVWVEAHPGEYHPYVNVKRYKEILKNKRKN